MNENNELDLKIDSQRLGTFGNLGNWMDLGEFVGVFSFS